MNEELRRVDDIRLSDIEFKLDKITRDVEDLVTAWKAASFLLSVVKGFGAMAVAIGSILILLKGGK